MFKPKVRLSGCPPCGIIFFEIAAAVLCPKVHWRAATQLIMNHDCSNLLAISVAYQTKLTCCSFLLGK